MNYWGANKPLHEFEPDELCEYAFNGIWDSLEYMFTYEGVSQKEVDEIIDYVSTIVKTLIDVLKKSLVYFYPRRSKDILEFTNICKLTKDYHLSLYSKDGSLTIIRKGIDALESLDKFSYSYLFHGKMKAKLNPCYHEKLPLSDKELKQKKDDFEKMKSAFMEYCLYSQNAFHRIKIIENDKNFDEVAKEIRPLVQAGKEHLDMKKKAVEYGRMSAGQQRNEAILSSIINEIDNSVKNLSARSLWDHFKRKYNGTENRDENNVYMNEDPATGEYRIYEDGDDKFKGITFNTFRGYVTAARKNLKNNKK